MPTNKKTTVKKLSSEKVTKTSKKKLSATVAEAQEHSISLSTTSGNYNPELRENCPLVVYFYQMKDLAIYALGDECAHCKRELPGDERVCDFQRISNLSADVYSYIFAGRDDMTRLTVVDQDIWLNTKDFAFTIEPDLAYENLDIKCYSKHDKSCTSIVLHVSGTAWRRIARTLVIAELSGAIKFIDPIKPELKAAES